MKRETMISILLFALISAIMVSAASADPTVIFDGSVALEEGTFTFVPYDNPTESYEVETMTDLGALDAASNMGGFTYNASDAYYYYFYSFTLDDIEGIQNDWINQASWFIYINEELAPEGLSLNNVVVGDEVVFLYAPYELTPEWETIVDTANATHTVKIDVRSSDAVSNIEDLQGYIDGMDAPEFTKCILNTRLDGAIYSLSQGRNNIAVLKLQSFKNAVERHEAWGNLGSEDAEYLTDEADYIIGLIQN